MADEEKNEEKTVEETKEAEMPKAFTDAMDTIDKDNKVAALKDTPAGEKEVPAGAGDEIPETGEKPEEPAAAGEVSAEDAETLSSIDPEVLEVCRDYGWDDKKIVQIAKISPELFDDVRAVIDEEQAKPSAEVKPAPKEEPKPQVDEIDSLIAKLDPDIQGAEVVGILKVMAARQKEGSKVLTEEQKRLQSERDTTFNVRIDSCFDKYKDVPDLGNSSQMKLNRRQSDIRKELFAHANVTATMRKIPIERAIEIEVNKYRNQGGKKAAQQELLNKLEQQKGRFTHRPTRRQSSDLASRKFETENEEKEALMAEAYKEANIED